MQFVACVQAYKINLMLNLKILFKKEFGRLLPCSLKPHKDSTKEQRIATKHKAISEVWKSKILMKTCCVCTEVSKSMK